MFGLFSENSFPHYITVTDTMKNNENFQQDAKKQILASAKKAFAEKGFDGARMGSIAARANVNQALLHYYFGNKENLYKEVWRSHALFGASLVNKLEEFSNALEFTPPKKLYLAIHLLVNIHLDALDAEFSKIISREMSDQREHFKTLLREYLIPRHEALEQTIIEGIQRGDFDTKNPLFVIIGINNFIMSFINSRNLLYGSSWYERLFGENHKETLLDFLIDHTFKALRPKGKRLKIPTISKNILQSLDKLIEDTRKETQDPG